MSDVLNPPVEAASFPMRVDSAPPEPPLHSPDPIPGWDKRQSGAVGGAAVMMMAKAVNFIVSFLTLAVVARLVTPADFGVVAMVHAATNFFSIFSDFGLSLVTVQRPTISQQQLSTLFWINAGFGIALAILVLAASPLIVWVNNNDTRLYAIATLLSLVFPISTLRVQHEALLKRSMLFRRLAVVRMTGILFGALVGIGMAYRGWGYWALVGQVLATEAGATIAAWLALGWVPGAPRRCEGIRDMLGFGGALSAHGFVGYWANNLDNILIGRKYGDVALGIYSNAYQLMMRPISLAGYGVGEAAIPAMSKYLRAGASMRAPFRRMFTLTCLLGFPVCVAGIFWADDIILTLLGRKYVTAIPILQVLCIAATARMLTTATGWVYITTDRPGRMLRWQLFWTPVVVLSFFAGLPYGPLGVAVGYAIANWVVFIPSFLYCFHGTPFSLRDILESSAMPLACAIASASIAWGVQKIALPELAAGPIRLAVLLSIAAIFYVVTTAAFVPLAREALQKGRNFFLSPPD